MHSARLVGCSTARPTCSASFSSSIDLFITLRRESSSSTSPTRSASLDRSSGVMLGAGRVGRMTEMHG